MYWVYLQNNNIAVVVDFGAIFHKVTVKPSDCYSVQFVWTDTPEENSEVEIYQLLVHIFGPTDSPSCVNFAVKTVVRDNLENLENYSEMTI